MKVEAMLPIVMVPATKYSFDLEGNKFYTIRIPSKGSYVDLAPEVYTEEDGDFNLFDETTNTFNASMVTKVLFAAHKYPALKPNQFFLPHKFTFDIGEVEIIGQVVEMSPIAEEG